MKCSPFTFTALLVMLTACGGLDHLPFELASQDAPQVLDPDDIAIGEVIYACGQWVDGEKPSSERLIVDIVFNVAAASGPATAEQEEAVLEHGGTVIYRYDAPVVRAEVPTSEIPELVGRHIGIVNHARSVPKLNRTDLEILVMYTRSVSESDIARIRQLGGRVKSTWTVIDGLSADIPDRSLSALRSEPAVSHVSLNHIGCVGL